MIENLYLCITMAKLKTISITYRNNTFGVAVIPDVFTNNDSNLLIGPQSLNEAVYNENGFVDSIACNIDERIYAYIEDNLFSLNLEEFLERVKHNLD